MLFKVGWLVIIPIWNGILSLICSKMQLCPDGFKNRADSV